MSPLDAQVVAIVGASSGIGLATARAAALQGAQVIMISQGREKLEEAARTVEGVSRPVTMDMLDRPGVEKTFGELGALDHLVLTAVPNEYGFFGPLANLRDDQLERSLDKLSGFVNVSCTTTSQADGQLLAVSVVVAGQRSAQSTFTISCKGVQIMLKSWRLFGLQTQQIHLSMPFRDASPRMVPRLLIATQRVERRWGPSDYFLSDPLRSRLQSAAPRC